MTTMHAHWIQREEKGKEGGTEISQIALQCNKGSAKVASNPKSNISYIGLSGVGLPQYSHHAGGGGGRGTLSVMVPIVEES